MGNSIEPRAQHHIPIILDPLGTNYPRLPRLFKIDPRNTSPRKRKAAQDAEGDEEHADHRYPAGPSSTSSGATSTPSITASTSATSKPIATTPALAPVPVPESTSTSNPEDIASFATTQTQNTLAGLSRSAIAQYPTTSTAQVDHSQAERDTFHAGTSSQHAAAAVRNLAVETNTGTAQQGTHLIHNIDNFQQPGNDIVQQAAEFIDILDGDEENTDAENHPVIILDDDDDDNDDENEDDESHIHSTQDIEEGDDSSGDSDATDRWRQWLRRRQQRYLDAQEHESAIVVEDEENDHDQDVDEELALNAPGRRYITTISSRSPSRPRSVSADPVHRNRRRRNRPYRPLETPSSPLQRRASSRSPDVVISDDDGDHELTAAGTSAGHAAAAAAAASSFSSNHQHHYRRRTPSAGPIFRFNMSDFNEAGRDDHFLGMNQMLREAMEAHERRRAEAAATAAATMTAIPAYTPPPRALPASISSIPPSLAVTRTSSSAVAAPSANAVALLPAASPVAGEATRTSSRITDRLRCSICLELPAAPTITRCGHLFCRPCITQAQALGMGRKCPVCRTPLTANRLQNMIFETAAPAPTLVE